MVEDECFFVYEQAVHQQPQAEEDDWDSPHCPDCESSIVFAAD
jgi:hypothetical protein